MIIPTLRVEHRSQIDTNVYGEPVFAPKRFEKVCPVKLMTITQHTTVRTDSSSSHGHASEQVKDVRLLALPTTKIRLNDELTVMGERMRVDKIFPRHRVTGALDHYELHCVAWV